LAISELANEVSDYAPIVIRQIKRFKVQGAASCQYEPNPFSNFQIAKFSN